jgi:hypothetical protein
MSTRTRPKSKRSSSKFKRSSSTDVIVISDSDEEVPAATLKVKTSSFQLGRKRTKISNSQQLYTLFQRALLGKLKRLWPVEAEYAEHKAMAYELFEIVDELVENGKSNMKDASYACTHLKMYEHIKICDPGALNTTNEE